MDRDTSDIFEATEVMNKAGIKDAGDEDHPTGKHEVQATQTALEWAVKQKLPSSASTSTSSAVEDA